MGKSNWWQHDMRLAAKTWQEGDTKSLQLDRSARSTIIQRRREATRPTASAIVFRTNGLTKYNNERSKSTRQYYFFVVAIIVSLA